MVDTAEYTGSSLRAFYPDRTERRTARVWANEALLHDMAAAFGFEFFEGAGTNPTGLSGYSATKLWLRVSAGVTTTPGEIRKYDGSGDATLLASWPVMTKAAFAAYISAGGDNGIPVVTSRAALKALDTVTVKTAHLRLGIESGTYQWWAGDYSTIVALDTIGGYAMKADAVATTSGAWLRVVDGDRLNALWFGVDRTGGSATHAAAQVAINVAAEAGYLCSFPPGIYQFTSVLTWPEASHIVGSGKAAGIYSADYTYFWANHSGACLTNNNNSGSRSISGVNFYRTQPTPTGGWVPTTYGFEIDIVGGQDITIEDVHLHNVSKGIRAIGTGTTVNGRIFIENVTGQPLMSGIDLTHCLDVVWIDEVHWWVFWSNNANVLSYMRQNAVAMTLGRVDNPEFGRFFCYSYFRGLLINQQGTSGSLPTGTVSLATFDSFGADNCGSACIVNSGTNSVDLRFGRFYGASNLSDPAVTNESFLWTLGNNATISIGDMYVQYGNVSAVAINGTGNRVTISHYASLGMDYDANGTAEFDSSSGNTLTLLSSPKTSATNKYTGAGIIETPDWRAYTPTVTAGTGSFTTVSATGKYRRLPGKSVNAMFHITITTNGTAASFVKVTLPFTNGSTWHFGASREIAATGTMCTASVAPSVAAADIVTYNNVYPGGTGTQIIGQVEYEAA
jgi:hypothetical protein